MDLSTNYGIDCIKELSLYCLIFNYMYIHLSPSGVQQMNEGGSFIFSCTVETGMTPPFDVFLDDSILTERLSRVSIPMGARYTFGPVTSCDSGSVLCCASANEFAVESATLDVTCECHPCM